MRTMHANLALVRAASERIRPMLAGLGPEIQGAVLADLFSVWLAGWQAPDEAREDILQHWLASVRELVPVQDAILHEGKLQ